MADTQLLTYLDLSRSKRKELINRAYQLLHGPGTQKFAKRCNTQRIKNITEKYQPILFNKSEFNSVSRSNLKGRLSHFNQSKEGSYLSSKSKADIISYTYRHQEITPPKDIDFKRSRNFSLSRNSSNLRSISPIQNKSITKSPYHPDYQRNKSSDQVGN